MTNTSEAKAQSAKYLIQKKLGTGKGFKTQGALTLIARKTDIRAEIYLGKSTAEPSLIMLYTFEGQSTQTGSVGNESFSLTFNGPPATHQSPVTGPSSPEHLFHRMYIQGHCTLNTSVSGQRVFFQGCSESGFRFKSKELGIYTVRSQLATWAQEDQLSGCLKITLYEPGTVLNACSRVKLRPGAARVQGTKARDLWQRKTIFVATYDRAPQPSICSLYKIADRKHVLLRVSKSVTRVEDCHPDALHSIISLTSMLMLLPQDTSNMPLLAGQSIAIDEDNSPLPASTNIQQTVSQASTNLRTAPFRPPPTSTESTIKPNTFAAAAKKRPHKQPVKQQIAPLPEGNYLWRFGGNIPDCPQDYIRFMAAACRTEEDKTEVLKQGLTELYPGVDSSTHQSLISQVLNAIHRESIDYDFFQQLWPFPEKMIPETIKEYVQEMAPPKSSWDIASNRQQITSEIVGYVLALYPGQEDQFRLANDIWLWLDSFYASAEASVSENTVSAEELEELHHVTEQPITTVAPHSSTAACSEATTNGYIFNIPSSTSEYPFSGSLFDTGIFLPPFHSPGILHSQQYQPAELHQAH
ncbi:hypothetical protein [Spongorhabdus nitratireducens]